MNELLLKELGHELAGAAAMIVDGNHADYDGGVPALVQRMREALDALDRIAPREAKDVEVELREALDELRCCVNERAAAHVLKSVAREAFIGTGGLWSAMVRADELLEDDMRSSRQVVPTAVLANLVEAFGSIDPYDRLRPGVLEALEVAADGGKAVWPS